MRHESISSFETDNQPVRYEDRLVAIEFRGGFQSISYRPISKDE